MSDNENNEEIEEKPFYAETAKQGRAACKKCKEKCPAGELRLAKLAYNPFGSDKLKQWYHPKCLFEVFMTQRPATKRLEDLDDVDNVESLDAKNRDILIAFIDESEQKLREKWGDKLPIKEAKPLTKKEASTSATTSKTEVPKIDLSSKDCLFREFRRLIAEITSESSYLEKSALIKNMFTKGSDGQGFKGDLIQWCRLLLPGVVKRIYNLQSKQLVKLFSRIFGTDQEEMLEDLEQGDVGETIQNFFEKSSACKPCKKSLLTLQEVDDFLEELSELTKEDEQIYHFSKIVKKCTANDLKIIIRLIKHDLRMNAGAKHVLDGVHPNAYEAFQSSRDLTSVLKRILGDSARYIRGVSKKFSECPDMKTKAKVKAQISVMTPVLPMLAEACKSVEQAMKKCPNGMYSEIKYDGERVQLHKHGNEFKYFSRSLKPVLPHKVNHFKEYIPKAFPHAKDLILDSEVLMIDTVTRKPLPFGSLGKHKKEEFQNANVCLFVFDCIYFNGEILTHKPMKERRKILEENMIEIKNHIMFSEVEKINKPKDLAKMIRKVLKLGLEGLVLKDLNSIYEPGKRHWLKVKKDYLCDGAMADSADLIVLGAWFGTGRKGGMMSVFLMGCYDKVTKKFLTITKVHTGHDDKTLERLQTELEMTKISCDPSKVPSWLKCTRTMVPDFVATNPTKQPVWEITGAEFTQHAVHTADGISIRFPRVTRIREDKTWEEATTLEELKTLFKNSKENIDFHKLFPKHNLDEDSEPLIKEENPESDIKTDKIKAEVVKTEEGRGIQNFFNKTKRKDLSPKIIKEEPDTSTSPKKESRILIEAQIKEEIIDESDSEASSSSFTSTNNRKRKSDSPVYKKPEYQPPKIKKLFPEIFLDTKIYVLDTFSANSSIFRHFLARGGEILDEKNRLDATHVVHKNESYAKPLRFASQSKHVVLDWIKDCVGNKKILDTRPYAVIWVPENLSLKL